MKKVAIVSQGEWGTVSRAKGSYDYFERYLHEIADLAVEGPEPDRRKAAESQIFISLENALGWLNGYGVMVFTTRGMEAKAEEIAQKHPDIRVILFSGLIPSGRVVYVDKGWDLPSKVLEKILLRT